jgi:hypothetical protein
MSDVATLIEGVVGASGTLAWTALTPGFTGFSVNPSSGDCRYAPIGKFCIVELYFGTVGTSNATSFTITGLPYSAYGAGHQCGWLRVMDNGSWLAAPGFFLLTTTVATIYKDGAGAAFTNANGKCVQGTIIYAVA